MLSDELFFLNTSKRLDLEQCTIWNDEFLDSHPWHQIHYWKANYMWALFCAGNIYVIIAHPNGCSECWIIHNLFKAWYPFGSSFGKQYLTSLLPGTEKELVIKKSWTHISLFIKFRLWWFSKIRRRGKVKNMVSRDSSYTQHRRNLWHFLQWTEKVT